ncbi:MAG: 16S rRNA (cytosine(1402)-N(4))-methyltransferase RsmH [Bacteroidales bacterium]|nr:16S rRNA (cytosine(1402)-N(4))-methyltransferase RsmH [Bacteroidales bacterium]
MSEYHNPVLLEKSVSALVTDPSGIYVDATFGGGGHSRRILEQLSPEGRLLAFDRDADAGANVPADGRFTLIHNNFRFVHNYVLLDAWQQATRDFREHTVDGILADLGVSSHQFDTAERGFSFRFDAPLDMRMNAAAAEGAKTAATVVNSYAREDLRRIFSLYGELQEADRLARLVVAARDKEPVMTTTALNAAIAPALPSFAEHKYLAKVYQALRIEVNAEMRSLEKFLEGAAASLRKGGRLVVITYHSLEDRMVKNFIKAGNVEGVAEKDMYGKSQAPFAAVNRKPILPEEEEIAANTRARSAKLRIAERV